MTQHNLKEHRNTNTRDIGPAGAHCNTLWRGGAAALRRDTAKGDNR